MLIKNIIQQQKFSTPHRTQTHMNMYGNYNNAEQQYHKVRTKLEQLHTAQRLNAATFSGMFTRKVLQFHHKIKQHKLGNQNRRTDNYM